jgi:hypothetical protein
MSAPAHTVDHSTLENLAHAGVLRSTCAVGQSGGWEIVVQYGNAESVLTAKRGEVRLFKKFDTLTAYLKKLGIEQFRIDARHFDPTAKEPAKRADSAERMRDAHEAVAYRNWLEDKVSASKAGLVDGSNKTISAKEWASVRALKQKQRDLA